MDSRGKDGEAERSGQNIGKQRTNYERCHNNGERDEEKYGKKIRINERIVVDTNIMIAAALVNGTSRNLLLYAPNEFIAPDIVLGEFESYRNYMMKKTHTTISEFYKVKALIFSNIEIVHFREYHNFIGLAKLLTKDIGDVPFVALALARQADIWSEDKGFPKNKDFGVFTTKDILEQMNRNSLNSDHKV